MLSVALGQLPDIVGPALQNFLVREMGRIGEILVFLGGQNDGLALVGGGGGGGGGVRVFVVGFNFGAFGREGLLVVGRGSHDKDF